MKSKDNQRVKRTQYDYNLGFKAQSVYKYNFKGTYKYFQHSISIIYKFGCYDEDNVCSKITNLKLSLKRVNKFLN